MSQCSLALLSLAVAAPLALARSPSVPQWQAAAGGKLEFEAASIRQSGPASPKSGNLDLDSSDYLVRYTGGLVTANGLLVNYIIFAYKIEDASQYPRIQAQLPEWAQKTQFYLESRPLGSSTKDQLRLMVQSLLANRFGLMLHMETRELPAYALTLDKPNSLGPQLQPDRDDTLCTQPPDKSDKAAPKSPGAPPAPWCGLLVWRTDSGLIHMRIMGHTVPQIAGELITVGTLGDMDSLPVVDRTGLAGRFDLNIEFLRETPSTKSSGTDAEPALVGPSFIDALKKQAGLKLVKQVEPVTTFVIDHVEPLSEN